MTDSEKTDPGRITELLQEAAHGRADAFDQLLPLVYDELRLLARGKLRFERPGHTLNTNALVHEAYFKLVDQSRVEWRSRHQFFGVASEAMRRILVDYAKRRRTAKRGGRQVHVPLDDAGDLAEFGDLFTDDQATELIALDDALARLNDFNPRGAQVIQYRFFGGLSVQEVADTMGVSVRTVRRAWTLAKAWLQRELQETIMSHSTLLGLDGSQAGVPEALE